MRNTWIKLIKSRNEVSVLFILALEHNESLAINKVRDENNLNQDILLIDMKDSHYMHAHKSLVFMEYFIRECYMDGLEKESIESVNPLFMKVTDDIVVIPSQLIRTLHSLNRTRKFRFTAGKYVEGPDPKDAFISGSAMVFSPQATREIYDLSRCLPRLLYQDDVLFTSFIRHFLKIDIFGLNFESSCDTWSHEQRNSLEFASKFAVLHRVPGFTPSEQSEIFRALENPFQSYSQTRIC